MDRRKEKMGYYAEIIDNEVARVLVVDGTEAEAKLWLALNVSTNTWIKTTLDGSSRNKYAGVGDEYHSDVDKFVYKVPFESWILDKDRGMYLPPIPKPLAIVVGYIWEWSVQLKNWISERLT